MHRMKNSIKTLIIFFVCLIAGKNQVFAQNTYLAEIGVHSGASTIWNRNSDDWKFSSGAMSGLILKYNPNNRFSFQINYERSGIDGITGLKNSFEFNSVFNMLEFGKLDYKLYSKNYAPFLFWGIGNSNFTYDNSRLTNAYFVPLGMGVKVKLKNRFNLNFQFTHRFYLPTNRIIENVYSEYSILRNNTNILNNSQLSSISIGISYDFWERACDCMKVNEKSKKRF